MRLRSMWPQRALIAARFLVTHPGAPRTPKVAVREPAERLIHLNETFNFWSLFEYRLPVVAADYVQASGAHLQLTHRLRPDHLRSELGFTGAACLCGRLEPLTFEFALPAIPMAPCHGTGCHWSNCNSPLIYPQQGGEGPRRTPAA